jgi:hypothetical protein
MNSWPENCRWISALTSSIVIGDISVSTRMIPFVEETANILQLFTLVALKTITPVDYLNHFYFYFLDDYMNIHRDYCCR